MLNLCHYIKSINKYIIITNRYLSISKSDLIESSRNIQELLKSSNDNLSISKWLYNSLNKIHKVYPSKHVATSTKEIYQRNSSKLNSTFLQLENDRNNQIGDFKKDDENQSIILLRYIRSLFTSCFYLSTYYI